MRTVDCRPMQAGELLGYLVAQGISVALLTTAYGLLVAFLTQPFYNYFVSRVMEHTNQIDVATHSLVDAMTQLRRASPAVE